MGDLLDRGFDLRPTIAIETHPLCMHCPHPWVEHRLLADFAGRVMLDTGRPSDVGATCCSK